MSVDILSIGNNRRPDQDNTPSIINPWRDNASQINQISPRTREQQALDRQVEVGLGSKIDNVMTNRDKQEYVDNLSDYDWSLMKLYKAEGYGFEASKALVDNKNKLANPNARGIEKYTDYIAKEQHYNNTGIQIDPDSALGKTALFLQKIGFDEQYGNPLNKLASQYNDWYAKERESVDTLMEDKEASNLEKIGWRLQRMLLSAESGIINSIAKVGNAGQGVGDIGQSAMNATLDRAILGLDTDMNFYREDDRRLDSYLWEGVSGGANLLFWALSPEVMTAFTGIGETKTGGKILDLGDNAVRWTVEQGLKLPGVKQYYQSLDEEGKENMLDSLTTGAYMLLMREANKAYGKFKTNTKPGQWIQQQENYLKNTRNLFKQSLEKGVEGAKEQIGKEVQNRRTATDLYDGATGKITGRYGEQGQTGIGKETSRVVQAGIDAFKKNFQEGVARSNAYNASKKGGAVNIYDSTQAYEPTSTETVVGKPTKGVVGKAKDIIQSSWNNTVTGLTPEERIRIQNDPYVREKFEKARTMIEEAGMPLEESIITENLYNEIGDKIIRTFDERENKLNETSPEYKAIKQLNTTYNLVEASPLISDLLLKNDITMDPVSGELDFSNSKFVSDADMRSVQRAVDMIYKDIATLLTPRKYLNLRDKLNQLAKYATVDASRGQSLIRQIRHTLDGVAKKQIPGLKELDDTTSKYFKEIAELKDGWVYKGGDRKGEVRNNFYSIIKNLTGHNRKVMLQRLEKYYPGVTEEIEAVHLTEKLVKAYNKSPQIIRAMGVGGGIAGGSGGNILKGLLGAIIGEMAQEGIIRPITKTWRMKAIDKLLSEISPEAQAKLQEIALRQTYAKEMSAEDRKVLNKVAEIIAKERERGLSEEALKERENRTKPLDQEALPGVQPDIIDENGNITLGRGNVISPEKGPGRPRKLTRINEINLKNPEATPDKQVLNLQEKLDIDTDTAKEIQSTIDDFLKDVGADEIGAIGGREVNYEKFTTRSLERLMDNENLPRTEKEKIKEILTKRGAEEEAMSEVKADWDFAMRIKQLSEEEQRIGKVGKNKVSKEVADKQMREWEKKKEALIKEMQEYYGIDQFEASDKYLDMEAKGDQYIREYKRSNVYKTETAEREVLDRLMEGWSKQPKFVRDMNEGQLRVRQDFLNNVKLQNGYTLETTDYNDRYVLEDNGSIVDRGAIKYLDDGTIEITAQTFDGIKESGLLDYLPDSTEIKEAGSDLWMSARELKQIPLVDTLVMDSEGRFVPITEAQSYYEFADRTPIDKFGGELTEQQIQEGKDLYQLASESLTPETENEIIEARGKFLTLNQRPGYTKALGLDQGEVNKTIMSWQRMSPELKNFVDKVHSKADPKYWFMGISNRIERDNPWRGIDSLKFLTDDVKAVDKDPNIRSYELEVRDTLDGIMLGNSKLSYETLRIRLTHREEQNAFNKELNSQKAVGEFFSDIDMLIVGEGKETVWHEEGHYISSLLGRKILGNRKAFDKGVREATSRDWERRRSSRYKSPEVGEFHEKILKLVESLDKSMTPQMKNDNRIMSDGTVMKDYRTKPDEKWARFWSASIEFTKKMAQTGKIPTKTFKSEHGDEYSLKQYESLIEILQEYQRLEDKGLFYEVEVPDETRVNKGTGLKDIEQKSLFEQASGDTALERYFKEKPYNIDIMYKTYDSDIVERRNNLQKKGRRDITMNELYEVKNMIDEHARDKGTQIDAPDGPTAQLLLEKAENMKSQKIGTYDKKQIAKIGDELKSIVYNLSFSTDAIGVSRIGKAYNPDVDVRYENIKDELTTFSDANKKGVPQLLTSLKAKIKELEKFPYEAIEQVVGKDGVPATLATNFIKEVKIRGKELQAQGVEKAVTDLVALSNMDVDKFIKQMEEPFGGKSPMPSIAVMDPNVPHEGFGALTVVFGRNTVDPKVDPANKMYGSDAWTPMFPEIKDKGSLGDYDKVKQMSSDVVDVLYNRGLDIDSSDLGYFAEELESQLLDLGGRTDLDINAERLAEQVFRDSVENLENDDFGIKNLSEKVVDTGAENTVVDMLTDFIRESTGGEQVIPARYFDETPTYRNVDQVAEELVDYVPDEVKENYDEGISGLNSLQSDILKVLNKNTDVKDRIANLLDALEMSFGIEYSPEVEEIVRRLELEEPGDRPLTPENILEAMKNQKNRRETFPGSFEDMIEIEGTELNDIEDVRRQNFAKVFHGDWTGDLGDLKQRYENLINLIKEEYVEFDGGLPEETTPDTQVIRAMIKDEYSPNIDEFMENLEENPLLFEIPEEVAQRIIDVVEQGKKIPIRFSESKPERIVDLTKEVEYILVPEGKDTTKVENAVKGTPLEGKVVPYTPDNYSAPRSRKMKELQKKYGNVFFSMGGVIMPIAMLYLMMGQEEEGQA